MLRQSLSQIEVQTRGRGFYELTGEAQSLLEGSKMKEGTLTLHVQHTSASLLIQENADPEVRRDLERFFARLVPDGEALFHHVEEGEDDMPAHVRCALTAVNLVIPFARGRLALGTWQGIYLWEHRHRPHRRLVITHLLGE
jgi:secondary thiamine-phosphate synthase enzyme